MPDRTPTRRTISKNEQQHATSGEVAVPLAKAQGQATLFRALAGALRLIWERLGLVVGVSLAWGCVLSVLAAVTTAIPVPMLLKWVLVTGAGTALCIPLLCGSAAIGWQLLLHDETGFSELFRIIAYGRYAAVRLGVIHGVAVAAIESNLWFYGHMRSAVGAVMFAGVAYIALMWLVLMMVQPALLYAQEHGLLDDEDHAARRGAVAVIRRSVYLVFSAPAFIAGMFLLLAICGLAMFVVAIPYVLFWLGFTGFVTASCVRTLLIRLGAIPLPPVPEPPVADEEFRIKPA